MASNDERDRTGDQMRPGRRPPVIDLAATEVRTDGVQGAASQEGAHRKPHVAESAQPATDAAAAGAEPAESIAADMSGSEPGRDGVASGEGMPPQDSADNSEERIRRWVRGGIAALLLIAGLLGGILLYRLYGDDYFPSPQVQEMLARLPALEQASRENRNRLDTFSEAVESLKARVTTLEEAANALRQDVSAMRGGVDEARRLAQRADSAAAELREGAAAASPANAEEITGLRQAVEAAAARLQTVESELGMVRQAQSDAGGAGQNLSVLTQRLEALEHNIQTRVQAEQQQAAERAAARTAIASSLESLREKVGNGEPFRTDIDTLRGQIGNSAELDSLQPHADQGVPTHQALQQRFATIRQNLENAAAEPEPEPTSGTWDALVHRLRSVVQIRPVDEVDWLEVTGRMEPYVRAGDYTAAARIAEAAGAPPPQGLADWLQAARARNDADDALARVTSQALERIQALSGSVN